MPGTAAKRLAALALGVALALAPLAAAADEERPSDAFVAVTGIASVLGTLIYAPFKLTHALTGTVVSGLAWLSTGGDGAVTRTIFNSSVGGDYVITPSHIQGERSLRFLGDAY